MPAARTQDISSPRAAPQAQHNFAASGGLDGELRRLLESAEGRMSDQRLADRLREAGYPVARRTVAKHRARLGFTAASLS